jgi:hypothetical protein
VSPASVTHAGEVVSLLLAGVINAANASQSLGLSTSQLEYLLGELGLLGAAMVPVEVDGELNTYFVDLGRNAFAAPLFDDVVDSYRRTGASAGAVRFRLSANRILQAATRPPRSCPAGLIFHVGRCGSTLLCNLLASADGWVTLKEPGLLNGLLLRLAAEPDPAAKEQLGTLVALLLRSLAHGVRFDAVGRERACVVKLTSWNAMFSDEFVWRLAPIPLVVVTRDPWATVGSFLANPPYWYDPGSTPDAMQSSARASREEAARVFAEAWNRTVERALRLPARRTLFVSYTELTKDPVAVLRRVYRHLGHGHERLNTESILGVTAQFSKGATGERFEPHGRHRRDALAQEVRDIVTTITARQWSELIARTV